MGKSRNRKWYDRYEDDDSNHDSKRRQHQTRRQEKRFKRALKTRDDDYFQSSDND